LPQHHRDRIDELLRVNARVRATHAGLEALPDPYSLQDRSLWARTLATIGSKPALLYRFLRVGNVQGLSDHFRSLPPAAVRPPPVPPPGRQEPVPAETTDASAPVARAFVGDGGSSQHRSSSLVRAFLIRHPHTNQVIAHSAGASTSDVGLVDAPGEDEAIEPSLQWLVRVGDETICPTTTTSSSSGRSDATQCLTAAWSIPDAWFVLGVSEESASADDAKRWTFTRQGRVRHRFSGLNLAAVAPRGSGGGRGRAGRHQLALARASDDPSQEWHLIPLA
jgi:hypothetical protein